MSVTKIVTPSSITVYANGKILVAGASHPNFKRISDILKTVSPDVDALALLFDIPQAIKTQSNGAVEVRDGQVFYAGAVLHSALTERMLSMMGEGFDITPLANFLAKLMKNPSHRAVTGLYDFLEATHIPITPDGNFLAYKKVRSNYFDIHSGTIRNMPGDSPRVARNQVDEDPDRTCSNGLHVCSASYLDSFGSSGGNDRIVVVEVSPEDVVAVPRDYNNAKMRCAGYTVIAEIPGGVSAKSVFNAPVMSAPVVGPAVTNTATTVAPLDHDESDVIRNIHGVMVRFYLDYEGNWVAEWEDEDGDTVEIHTGEPDLEDAIAYFKDEIMEEVCSYTATLRWLEEDGDVVSRVVELKDWDANEAPDDSDFTEEADIYEDGVRVIGVAEVPGTRKWRLTEY